VIFSDSAILLLVCCVKFLFSWRCGRLGVRTGNVRRQIGWEWWKSGRDSRVTRCLMQRWGTLGAESAIYHYLVLCCLAGEAAGSSGGAGTPGGSAAERGGRAEETVVWRGVRRVAAAETRRGGTAATWTAAGDKGGAREEQQEQGYWHCRSSDCCDWPETNLN